MTSTAQKPVPADVREAVRDTVAYRYQPEATRSRPSRSHTSATPATSSRPAGKRSQSEDSSNIVEKPRSSGKSRPKKGSKHADVIDRLDFTGVGPMFHHDGPFDACAPSRNKHNAKAPMSAWSPGPEEISQQYGNGAYPAYPHGLFSEDYPEPPKKKVDAIAEAWGIHEPEPFEEFYAGGGTGKTDTPASSIYNGRAGQHSHRIKEEPREGRSRAPISRRTAVPPPQPIFVPEVDEVDQPVVGSPPAGGSGPKRSKSLMHRIRRMRDAPNVPVSSDYEAQPPSPSTPTAANYEGQSTRPTHRSQNSFLGRFGMKSSNQSAPNNVQSEQEPYVFIDNQNDKDKALPATPMERSVSEAQPQLSYSDNRDNQQLGRKTSIMRKVGRVVRGR